MKDNTHTSGIFDLPLLLAYQSVSDLSLYNISRKKRRGECQRQKTRQSSSYVKLKIEKHNGSNMLKVRAQLQSVQTQEGR